MSKKTAKRLILLCSVLVILCGAALALWRSIPSITMRMLRGAIRGTVSVDALEVRNGEVAIRNLVVKTPRGETVVSLPGGTIRFDSTAFIRTFDFPGSIVTVTLDSPSVSLRRSADGTVNVEKLVKPAPAGRPGKALPFRGVVTVRGATVTYRQEGARAAQMTVPGVEAVADYSRGASAVYDVRWDRGTAGRVACRVTQRFDEPRIEGRLTVRGADLPALAPFFPSKGFAVTAGRADGEVTVRGRSSWAEADYFGRISFRDCALSLPGLPAPLRDMTGACTVDRNHATFSSTKLTVGSLPLTVKGEVFDFTSPELLLTVDVAQGSLGSVKPLLFKPGEQPGLFPTGLFDAHLLVKGPAADPVVEGTLTSRRLDLPGEALSHLSLKFQYGGGVLKIVDGSVVTRAGRVSARGVVLPGRRGRLLLDVKTSGTRLAVIPGAKDLRGTADANLLVAGYLAGPVAVGSARVHSLGIDGVTAGDGTLHFFMDQANVFLDAGRFAMGGGTVDVTGAADLKSKEFNAFLRGKGVAVPQRVIPSLGTLTGALDFTAEAGGTFAAPRARAFITGGRATMGKYSVTAPGASLAISPAGVVLEGARVRVNGSDIFGSGYMDFSGSSPWQVRLQGSDATLAGLAVPGIDTLRGKASIDLLLRGAGASPKVDIAGRIRGRGIYAETSASSPAGKVRGTFSLGMSLYGPLANPVYFGWARGTDVTFRGAAIPGVGTLSGNGAFRISLEGKGANPYVAALVNARDVTVKNGKVSSLGKFSGSFALDAGAVGKLDDLHYFGALKSVDFSAPAIAVPGGGTVAARGSLVASFDGMGLASPRFDARVTSDGLTLGGAVPQGAFDGVFNLDVRAAGDLKAAAFHGWLKSDDANIPAAALPGVGTAYGKGALDVYVEGSTASPGLEGYVRGRAIKAGVTSPALIAKGIFDCEGWFGGASGDMWYTGHLSGKDVFAPRVRVPDVGLVKGSGSFDLDIEGRGANASLQGRVKADSASILEGALPGVGTLWGEGSADIQISGPLDMLHVRGTVAGRNLFFDVKGQPGIEVLRGAAQGTLAIDGDARGLSYTGNVRSDGLAFSLKDVQELRSAAGRGLADFAVEGWNDDISFSGSVRGALSSFETKEIPGVGTVSGRQGIFDIALTGTPESPWFAGDVEGKSLSFVSEEFPEWGRAQGAADFTMHFSSLGDDMALSGSVKGRDFTLPAKSLPTMGELSAALDFDAAVAGTARAPKVSGTLTGGWGRLGKLAVSEPRGSFTLRDRVLFFRDVSVEYGASTLTLNGTMGLDDNILDLDMISSDLDLAKVRKDLPFEIPLTLLGPAQVTANLWGDPDVGFFLEAASKSAQGAFRGSVFLPSAPEERFMATLFVEEADLASLLPPGLESLNMRGSVSGEATLFAGEGSMDVNYLFNVRDGALAGIPMDRGSGTLVVKGSRIESVDSRLGLAPGGVCVKGWIDTGSRTLDLSTRTCYLSLESLIHYIDYKPADVNLREIVHQMNLENLTGDLVFDGAVRGTFDNPTVTGNASIPQGFFFNEPLTLASKFSASSERLKLDAFELVLGERHYTAFGEVAFKPEINLDVTMDFEGGRISDILSLTPRKDLPAEGRIDGRLKLGGNFDRPSIDGIVNISRGSLFSQSFEEATIDLRSTKEKLSLENFWLRTGVGEISGAGTLTADGALNFSISGRNLPLGQMPFLRLPMSEVEGAVSFDLTLGGTRADPTATFTFSSDDLVVNKEQFGRASGTASWRQGELALTPLTLEAGEGVYDLRGAFYFPGGVPLEWKGWNEGDSRPAFSLKATASNGDLSTILSVLGHPWKDRLDGRLSGRVTLDGRFPSPEAQVEMLLADMKIGAYALDTVVLKGDFRDRQFHLDDFSFSSPQTRGTVYGTIDSDGRCDMTASVKSLPVEMVRAFTEWQFSMGGSLDFEGRLSGLSTSPDLTSRFDVQGGNLSGFTFDRFHGEVSAEKGAFNFQNVELLVGKHKTRFGGTLPLAWKDGHIESAAPMNLTASFSEDSLDILSLFTPNVLSTEGKLKGAFNVTGMLANPWLDGEVSVRQGVIRLKQMKNAIENLNGDVSFRGGEIDIPRFDGRLGQGKFTLAKKDPARPSVTLKGLEISELNMNLKGENLLFLVPGYFNGQVDVDVFLTKSADVKRPSLYNTDASGFTLRDATIIFPLQEAERLARQMAEGRTAAKGSLFSFPEIDVNLEFNMDKNVWIKLFNSTIAAKGYPNLRGVFPDLILQGDVHLSKGTMSLPFFSAPIKLYKGTAYFQKDRPWDPYLDLEAETTISGYRIFFGFLGYKDKNEFTYITSDPPDIPQDQLKKMLTGQAVTAGIAGTPDLQKLDNIAKDYLVNQLLVSPITELLGKTLSLNDVTLEFAPLGGYSLKLAKALDPDEKFYLTYTRIIMPQGQERQLWGLEYRFRRGMLLRWSNDNLGTQYFFFQAIYELGRKGNGKK